ncbi:MAG: hypothetical protein KAI45_02995 [Melioribacteraceae bacterium]|nr:hypothetical protein [Melioribacteraceae bacterium]
MSHVGFNITENKLQLIEVVEKSKVFYLENVDEETFPELLNFQSSDFINILQTAFDNLNQRNQLKSKKVSIALPADLFRIFSFPLETPADEIKLREQIEWEFSMLLPTLSFSDHIIRQKKISKGINSYPEILVIAIDQKPVKALYDFLIKNNLALQFIDNAHFTSDLLIKKNNSTSIYASKNAISCCSYSNNELIGYRKFEPNNNVNLIDYLNNSISQMDNNLSEFFISGDVKFDALQREIEDSLKISFNIIDPFSRIQLSESFIQNDHFVNQKNLFSSAAGICFRTS